MESERSFNEKNIAEFRANKGKVGGQFEGFALLLLTSTGAKTGAERVNPVGYFDIDGKMYIVGSAAGRDANPAWVANIRADPHVTVEIGGNPAAAATTAELAAPNANSYSGSSNSARMVSPTTKHQRTGSSGFRSESRLIALCIPTHR
ncbi:deazaflavin-dependent oxidoreductase, nitroreductase family protein [Mycobacterium avium MAV_120709_2344]|nr:deazaflavin-dependent oxidoreductase, nitroreductase family protein [Mycobacterium avium MAV_120709_2344]